MDKELKGVKKWQSIIYVWEWIKKQEPVRFLRINSFKFNLKLKQDKFFNIKEWNS
jgi:hypothetical protein